MQVGDDSMECAEDDVGCGRIQQSFASEPQVRG
jgi:hypothetical protein